VHPTHSGGVDTDKTSKLSFETALTKLEAIVDSMEQGEVPLAELLGKYEDGTKLLKVCEARLKEAELKIEQLKKHKDGSTTLESFAPARGDQE
jgi:exodeoxyribonuclease VII small subunit